jgi:hypothetical protein
MIAHGAHSILSLVPPADERCYCLGTPSLLPPGDVARGESWSKIGCPQVADEPMDHQNYTDGRFKCMPHTMAHAAMVEPLARFVIESTRPKAATDNPS